MAEIRKFKETRPLDTPAQNSKENPDKIKNGNETGVGTDFTQKYNEVFDRVQKEKFPNYIDPSTFDIANYPDLMDKFRAMSQMKESLLKAVDEELKNPAPAEAESQPEEEKQNGAQEEPVFTQEDQLLSEKLEKEIYDLKEEILNLEKQRAEFESTPEPKTEKRNETTNEEKEEVPANAPERKEIITEYVEIEDYKKAIDKIVINKLGDAFEKNGLDYEDTLVKYNNGKVHTEIKFNYGKVTLAFDLVSHGGRAILTNDEWKQGRWNKFVTLNKLNKKNAEQWSNIIINEFAKTKSKDNKPMKIDIKDGMLEVQHQI